MAGRASPPILAAVLASVLLPLGLFADSRPALATPLVSPTLDPTAIGPQHAPPAPPPLAAAPMRSVFGYGGFHSDTRLVEILRLDIDPQRSFIGAGGMSQRLYRFDHRLDLEAEVLVAKHAGKQHHLEFAGAISLRWNAFPWDHRVNTSMAYGHGPSFATSAPTIEASHERGPRQRLLFMVAEVAMAPPNRPEGGWEGLLRVHHRSGVFKLLSSGSGSNFISLGLRYRY
jgi:hypothetical protein